MKLTTVMRRSRGRRWAWAALWLLMGAASADEALLDAPGTAFAGVSLKIILSEWRADIPANMTWIRIGGGIEKSDFPALSSDRLRIALLYKAGDPHMSGYPVFEIWSTKLLKLLRRIPLVPRRESSLDHDVDTLAPEVIAAVKQQLVEVNRILADGGYRPMVALFKLPQWGALNGIGKFGKHFSYPRNDEQPFLTITSAATGHVDLKLKMPLIFLGPENDENRCIARADPNQGWYDPVLRIVVIQLDFSGARDGCEQSEQWVLKRLQ